MQTYSMRISTDQFSSFILKIGVFFLMFSSMKLYFTWPIPISVFSIITLFSCLIFWIFNKKDLRATKTNLHICGIFIIIQIYELFFIYNLLVTTLLFTINAICCGCTVILLNNKLKKEFLTSITKITAILIAISLFGWILFLVGVPLPNYYSDTSEFYKHTSYYIFLLNGTQATQIIPRFAGLFLEPGHLATTCCFLLFINKFNFKKWENIVLVLGIIFSLSLAGYGLLIGAALLNFILYAKHKIIYLFLFILFIIVLTITAINFNDGENIIYQRIISRLEFNNGEMAGNNRFTDEFESHYSRYIESNKKFWGMAQESKDNMSLIIGSAGWKRFIYMQGIIGTVLVVIFYLIYLLKYWSLPGSCLLIICLVANIIRDYPLQEYWLYIYIFSIPLLKEFSMISKKQNRISLNYK